MAVVKRPLAGGAAVVVLLLLVLGVGVPTADASTARTVSGVV